MDIYDMPEVAARGSEGVNKSIKSSHYMLLFFSFFYQTLIPFPLHYLIVKTDVFILLWATEHQL